MPVMPRPSWTTSAVVGVLLDGVADPVRKRKSRWLGIDVHLEGLRILLEQRLLAFGQLVGVLRHVLRGDGEQRLLVRVRAGLVAEGLGLAGPGLEHLPVYSATPAGVPAFSAPMQVSLGPSSSAALAGSRPWPTLCGPAARMATLRERQDDSISLSR